MSQHQPHQGTTTEGMSFTTRWKGKKNRKAQHHTALSSIPLPEKGRTTQETTSYYRTNDLKKKKSRRMPDHHFLQKDTDTDLQQSERLLVSKTWPCHKSRLNLCHSDCQFHLLTSAAAGNGLVLLQTSHRGQGRLGRTLTVILTVTFFYCIQ